MAPLGGTDTRAFARRIKQIEPDLPVVLLADIVNVRQWLPRMGRPPNSPRRELRGVVGAVRALPGRIGSGRSFKDPGGAGVGFVCCDCRRGRVGIDPAVPAFVGS